MRLIAEPLIPYPLWITLALLVAIVMLWYGWTSRMAVRGGRRSIIVAMMTLAAVLPLVVLLNLTWIENVPPPAGKPVVRVLIDTSGSMSTRDMEGRSRLSAATDFVRESMDDWSDRFDVRVATFDDTMRASDMKSVQSVASADVAAQGETLGNVTNVASALAAASKEDVPQGQSILLLSDGIHNASAMRDVLESAAQAQAMDVPVFAMTLGGPVGVKNVAVTPRSPQELSFVGQEVPVVARVTATGIPRRPVEVSLWKGDEKIATKEVQLDNRLSAEAQFSISDSKPGLYRYSVRVAKLPGEATVADNQATLLCRVVDRPVKMLLVEGKPYWDTKFLLRRLAADSSLEVMSVIRMAKDRYLRRTVVIEAGQDAAGVENSEVIRGGEDVLSAESLQDFQIVLLGRDAECFLTDQSLDALRNWISRDGGSLVCARGAPEARVSERLAQILPVRWTAGREQRFRVSMTSSGNELRWMGGLGQQLESMPSLATVAGVAQPRGLANVLAATASSKSDEQISPVISYQPYGSGRTVVVEGAGMWRWALMAPRYSQKEEVYGTLWRSLLRWLVARAGLLPGQQLSLQLDRVSYESGSVVTATMLVRPESVSQIPRVRLRSVATGTESNEQVFDQQVFDQEYTAKPVGQYPGVYRFDFGKLPAGQYSAETVAEDEDLYVKTALDVRDRWTEQLQLDARPELMQRIADLTGGAVLESADADDFTNQFADHLADARTPQFRRVTMWDRWWGMLSALLLWAGTWVLRRRSGLV